MSISGKRSRPSQSGCTLGTFWTRPEGTECHIIVRVLRRPVIRPDVQLLRLAIVAEGGE